MGGCSCRVCSQGVLLIILPGKTHEKADDVDNQETLKQAMQAALDRGWRSDYATECSVWLVIADPFGADMPLIVTDDMGTNYVQHPFQVIYDQEFAKALWGADGAWQRHLQEMVTSPDPLKYLAENL